MTIRKFGKKIFACSSIVNNSYFIKSFFCLLFLASGICVLAENKCSQTSKAALRACRNEIRDDYFIAVGNCLNLLSVEEQESCKVKH